MFPPKGSGLEQIKKTVERSLEYYNKMIPTDIRPINIPNPMESLQKLQTSLQATVNDIGKNLSAAISQITKITPREDYNEIAKRFIPADARILTPENPLGSDAILRSDLDCDSENELVASYKLKDGGITTIILKKRQDIWEKEAEFTNPDSEGIHYRNTVDIAGKGRLQLILGLTSKRKYRTLFGYALNNKSVTELFSQNYSKIEVLGSHKSKARFALWNENDDGAYDIDLMGWNGKQLDRLDSEQYYFKKALPHLAKNLKRQPDSPSNWYIFADALAKAGAKKDALAIIEYGRKFDKNSEYTEKYRELTDKL